MKFYGNVSYHDYEGPALNLEERARLVEHLGQKSVMLLRNHGTLVTGGSIPEAFVNLYYFENACRIQVDALASGRELVMPPEDVRVQTQQVFSATELPGVNAHMLDGSLEWAAIRRQLDRTDASYRR
jgi:ribulose-5-phosphate 4-epimerase/fuculose-1-phosphate aldolase